VTYGGKIWHADVCRHGLGLCRVLFR